MKIKFSHSFEDIVSVENILEAWKEFIKGKRDKKDVQEFSFRLMDNVLALHIDLNNNDYTHGKYQMFKICDPKPRIIHKAEVRDRLLHHAVYQLLYPFFDKTFIPDSFSCRNKKGTHKAINKFYSFSQIVSENSTKNCWVLKCDIKKFFASINQQILMKLLRNRIFDEEIISLLRKIIFSFYSFKPGTGLPLGNLTSQLFANIYMNEFDQFVKHNLRMKYYIRYADDFVVLSKNKEHLKNIIAPIKNFLEEELNLEIHLDKISIKTLYSGIDFLGWVNFSDHRILRRGTRKRMLEKLRVNRPKAALASYLGLLSHGNANKVKNRVMEICLRNYYI